MRSDFKDRSYSSVTDAEMHITPLMLAAWDSDYVTVAALLQDGAGVNTRTIHGETALHGASLWGAKSPTDAIKTIDVLLAAGAEINAQGKNGVTPLMLAGYSKSRKIVKHLLEQGADPNLRRIDGKTLLDSIDSDPRSYKGAKRLVALLKRHSGIR